MVNSYDQESSTAMLTSDLGSGDSYELKHILSVASAYLESGQVDDAEDLLQDALEAGADHPDVQALSHRLDHIRGRTSSSPVDQDDVLVRPDVLTHFTAPLPGIDVQPAVVQRYARTAERHYTSQQVHAALDMAYLTIAAAPGFLPGFVRLAEIQLALGNIRAAEDIYQTLSHRYAVHEETPDWMVESLRISLDPGDTTALLGYATSLVESGEVSALEPFVPEAISRSVDMNADAAMTLAGAYLGLRPDRVDVQRLYLEVVAATGDETLLAEGTRRLVDRKSPLDLLMYRAIAEAASPDGDWLTWLEQLASEIRSGRHTAEFVDRALELALAYLPREASSLFAASVALAAQRWQECIDYVTAVDDEAERDPLTTFICVCCRTLALEAAGNPEAAPALLEAARLAQHPDVETVARSTSLFGRSVSPEDLLQAYAHHNTGDTAVDALTTLRDANPERLDVRAALADAQLASGSVNDAVRELRYIAEEYEKAGNLAAMVDAMRKISHAVPANAEMKAKLIEGYLRRGVLDEALDELDLIGDLYLERGKVDEAVAALTRAAEIASTLGEFERGNALFDRAVDADPDNVPVRHAAVAFYLQTGSIDQAADQLRQVVRIALDAVDHDEAVAALHQIIALAPQDAETYHRLGEVLTAMGEYTQAERVYRRLATFTPFDPVLEAKQSALAVLASTN